jgi:serine/threonine protein kinase
MASVWLARQHGKHGFEKLVAVKTILPLYANDLRFQQMFLDEARIASGIEHPNVAQILDLGEEKEVLYLAMEWVDGDSLSKLFRAAEKSSQTLPIGIICRILADTCAGLHAAHELHDKNGELLNVVHRDVSPQNILVSTKGQVKLIDFGIAKARDRVAGDTNTGFLKGKILYMAPEQALGRPVDRRADVWAIGTVLYHMLAGVPPFEGANQLATLHLLTQEAPLPPLPSHIPEPVVEVVRRALVRDPESRIANADELQRLLERAMRESGQTAIQTDVAAFVNKQLVDRVEARRKAMDLALEAARHRQKLQQMLQPANPDSSSGIGHALRTRHAATPSGARLPASPNSFISSSGLISDGELPSSATLGSAALVASRNSLTPGRKMAIVGSVLGVCALVAAMALGIAIARSSNHHDTSATQSVTDKPVATATATAPPKVETAAPPETTVITVAQTPTTPTTTVQGPAASVVVRNVPGASTTASVRPKPTTTSTSKPSGTSGKTVDDGF